VLVGRCTRTALPGGLGDRVEADLRAPPVPMQMPVQRAFEASERAPLPSLGWLLLDPAPDAVALLRTHGLQLAAAPGATEVGLAEQFAVSSATTADVAFQGHREVSLAGAWVPGDQGTKRSPPATAPVFVSARQPLAVLAAQLLEPLSEDSLFTYGLLPAPAAGGSCAVLRLQASTAASL
jgi:hypothetical protein